MNFKSYNDLSNDIKNNISKIHTGNYDLVVGFPRSGMIPAHMIALYLNTHVTDFESFLNNKSLKCGLTRNVRVNLKKPHDAENILLVDDSIYSGNSIKNELKANVGRLLKRIFDNVCVDWRDPSQSSFTSILYAKAVCEAQVENSIPFSLILSPNSV